MQAVILKCRPRARFHFGKVAPDNDTSLSATTLWLPSDTLFSAVVNNLAALYPDNVNDLLQHFQEDRVRFSSGFYLLRVGERDIHFLPKPAHYGFEVEKNFKEFNQVKLISRKVWEKGWRFEEWGKECYFLQNKSVVVAKDELPELTEAMSQFVEEKECERVASKIHLFEEEDFPRVKIHAMGQDDAFFYLSAVCIAEPAELEKNEGERLLPDSSVHLYFLLDVAEGFEKHPDFAKIRAAIRLLADNGIGGERSAGCGLLERVEFQNFTPPVGLQQCAVSLVLPVDADELQSFVAYQVATRGGREYTGGKLQFVRMMEEGAVAKKSVKGRIAAIGPKEIPETFLRYGKAFCLPVRAIEAPKSIFES